MAEFVWEARARTGELRRGIMEGADVDTIESKLRGQQLTPVSVKKKPFEINLKFGSGVGTKDLVTFTRLFATMIDAGLPIVQCLDILQGQTDNPHFSTVIKDIKGNVEGGSTFSESLRKHPKVFDHLYTNLVQAGEVGGILDTILQRLATYNEKAMKLARQVRGAMVYPSVVVVVFALVLAVLLGWVIPSFETIFKDMGGKKKDGASDLPALTQLVIAISRGFVNNFFIVVAILVAIIVAVVYAYKTPKGKKFFHRLFLKVPVIGDVLSKIAVARFTRTLGTLLGSGVPILDALEIVAKTAGNVIIEEGIMYTRQRVSEGKNVAEPLAEAKVFPPMVVQMVGVGEQTGQLDQMLNKIADFYEDEVDVAVGALTSLIEPVMMVVVGGTVGVVLIAMYLPIFSLAGKIKAE
jgi:type IV pilus assembly protein PilC